MVSFALGRTYSVAVEGAGLPALREGWSAPEAGHTWSDGPRAALEIPLADSRAVPLRLCLNGTLAAGPMVVRVFTDGRWAMDIWKPEAPPREHSIMLSVSPAPFCRRVLSIALEFGSTFCPKDAGIGSDARHLGFALRSFTITAETQLAASLKSLIRWRSPRLTLALRREEVDIAFDLGRLLAECGLHGWLINLLDGSTGQPHRVGHREQAVALADLTGLPNMPPNGRTPSSASANGTLDPPLRELSFPGTLLQLMPLLVECRSFPDLIVLSARDLFGQAADALDPFLETMLDALPDIAICTDDTGFLDQAYFENQARHDRMVPGFGMAMVDAGLTAFIRRGA